MIGYAVLLHGVNVGGNRRVPMAAFRKLLGTLGYTEIVTVLNSGNAVIATEEPDPDAVVAAVHGAILDALGLDVTVQVRTADQLEQIVRGNPIPEGVDDPSHLLVTFLTEPPPPDSLADFDPAAFPNESVALADGTLYIHYRNGVGRSTLNLGSLGRFIRRTGTARNWSTVHKLCQLARERTATG